jgi:hypothetical protein
MALHRQTGDLISLFSFLESRLIMIKKVRVCGLDSSRSEWGPVEGTCEHDNQPFDSTKSS